MKVGHKLYLANLEDKDLGYVTPKKELEMS